MPIKSLPDGTMVAVFLPDGTVLTFFPDSRVLTLLLSLAKGDERVVADASHVAALSMRFSDLELSAGLANALVSAGCTFLWQIAEQPPERIAGLLGIGPVRLRELRLLLGGVGLSLDMDLTQVKGSLPSPVT